jgi:hypothetical protein
MVEASIEKFWLPQAVYSTIACYLTHHEVCNLSQASKAKHDAVEEYYRRVCLQKYGLEDGSLREFAKLYTRQLFGLLNFEKVRLDPKEKVLSVAQPMLRGLRSAAGEPLELANISCTSQAQLTVLHMTDGSLFLSDLLMVTDYLILS